MADQHNRGDPPTEALSVQLLASRDTLQAFDIALPAPPARVLDVGCGQGVLTSELARRGYDVTGLEPETETAEQARTRGLRVLQESIGDHHGGPYEAIVFSRSLHHIHPLDQTVAHTLELLKPGGMLLAEEFGRERADSAAAAFFFDNSEVLAAAGILDTVTDHPDIVDPLERWRAELSEVEHDHELHTSSAIATTLRERAELGLELEVPYLWRHIVRERAHDPDAQVVAIARTLHAIEVRRISEGSLPAVGVLFAARRR